MLQIIKRLYLEKHFIPSAQLRRGPQAKAEAMLKEHGSTTIADILRETNTNDAYCIVRRLRKSGVIDRVTREQNKNGDGWHCRYWMKKEGK